jgi:serine/threonine protein phosphatase 1
MYKDLKLVKTLKLKPSSKLFIVGDIHGEFSRVHKALKKVKFDFNKDILVCTGDIINKGNESKLAFEYLKKRWFYSIMGNHEMVAFLSLYGKTSRVRKRMSALWENQRADWFFEEKKAYRKYIKTLMLPVIIEVHTKNYKIGITHAGVPKEFNDWNDYKRSLDKASDLTSGIVKRTLWDRRRFYHTKKGNSSKIRNIDFVFSGHTPSDKLVSTKNQFWLDNGLVYDQDKSVLLVKVDRTIKFINK